MIVLCVVPQPMSLSAYARRCGKSAKAVSKAIASGRLGASVVYVGNAPKIADPELADREWQANTRPRIDHPPAVLPKATKRPPPSKSEDLDPSELPPGVPAYDVSRAVREFHESRRSGALADVAEIERDQVLDAVVPVEEARAYMIEKFTLVKTKLLGVPSRVAQQLPKLAKEIVPVVDKFIREALDELDAEDDGDAEEDSA